MRSNNTNKLSPQEHGTVCSNATRSSNNTNKLSPQELEKAGNSKAFSSNNTNKLSPQEQLVLNKLHEWVQIIQINLVLKNCRPYYSIFMLYLQYILSISIIKC